jgi:hypothetical protein
MKIKKRLRLFPNSSIIAFQILSDIDPKGKEKVSDEG